MTGLPLRGGGLGRKQTRCHSQPPRAGTTACHPSLSCPTAFAPRRGVQAHSGKIPPSWHTQSLKFPNFPWTRTNIALNMYLCKVAHPNWAAVERSTSCFRQCLHIEQAWNIPCARDPTQTSLHREASHTKIFEANLGFASSSLLLDIQMFSAATCRKPWTGQSVQGWKCCKENLCDLELRFAQPSMRGLARAGAAAPPPASITASTNLLDRLVVWFRGQKFMRGFTACFLGAASLKSLRSSSAQVLPENKVSKC